MKRLVFALGLLAVFAALNAFNASVYFEQGKYQVKYNVFDLNKAAAAAIYEDTYEMAGWDILRVATNNKFDDNIAAYAAGYLEGVLTQKRIFHHYTNMKTYTWNNQNMPEYISNFFLQQKDWIETSYAQKKDDPYWQQIYNVHQQFLGLVQGYNDASPAEQAISLTDMHTISSFGDLFEIQSIKHDKRPNYDNMTTPEITKYFLENTHCSALIKVTPDLSDIFFGHTSWWTYSSMIRIYKEYNFPFNNTLTKAVTTSFSSYPANLGSNDDFYMTSAGLVVIETSNGVFNNALFDLIKPQSLLCWQRVVLANRMADNGRDWVKYFSTYNSGTYNNQYMALDLKQFAPGQQLNDDLLWVAEQLPGQVESADVTNILEYGYYPSYNVPFFPSIRNLSGYDDMLKKRPEMADSISYQHCFRANIFRRDQAKVENLDGFKSLIRYNNYKYDPLSKGHASYAISSRADLETVAPGSLHSCHGGYDAKVSSYSRAFKRNLSTEIINGPTYDNVPAFEWQDQCGPRFSHVGQPAAFKFPWYHFESTLDYVIDQGKK